MSINLCSKKWAARSSDPVCGHDLLHWVKVKNPNAPAVTREAEEDWGR